MSDEQKPVSQTPKTTPTQNVNPPLPQSDNKAAPKLSPDAVSRTESKASQLFRSFLRWAVLAFVVFGLGVLVAIFLFYSPKSNELKLANQELATANARISELETEITSLENKIASLSSLEETNQNLQNDLDQRQIHIYLLNALNDIRAAQYALARDDSSAANVELSITGETLTQMQALLENDQAEMVNSQLSRLELVLGEIDTDPFAAQSDLEVLAVSLLQLETSLFIDP